MVVVDIAGFTQLCEVMRATGTRDLIAECIGVRDFIAEGTGARGFGADV